MLSRLPAMVLHEMLPAQIPPQGYTLQAIQAHVGGALTGDPTLLIVGVNALEQAEPGQLTFAESEKYLPLVHRTRGSAIIVPQTFPPLPGRTLLRVDEPRLAFLRAVYLFQPRRILTGEMDRRAVIAPDAQLGERVTIRECAVVRPHARIGDETILESGVHVGEGVHIGRECFMGPNVVIMRGCQIGDRVIIHGGTVIGADGFGYIWADGRHLKIPQVGNVVIEDDVELGANVCVDRATFGSTIIRRGTKIDNLVQIAHNDIIGEHVTMSGQVGLAGSVRVGNRVVFGGQAGVADHIAIGDDARIGAGSGVIKDVPDGETVWWFPARPIKKVKAELAALAFLPRLVKQFSRTTRRSAGAPRRTSPPAASAR